MTTVEEAQAVLPTAGSDAVKARGYWELIWIRLRRDRLAIAGGVFIVVMFFVAFIGAPIAAKLLGHGPNEQFFDAIDPDTFLPVGPMTRVKTPDGGTTRRGRRQLAVLRPPPARGRRSRARCPPRQDHAPPAPRVDRRLAERADLLHLL